MKSTIKVLISAEIRDALTHRIIKRQVNRPNLLSDLSLTNLALGIIGPATMFQCCKIGSSTAPNCTPSTPITFTQAGTTITAIAPFFIGSMVGQIFKYGTGAGGTEQYIDTVAGGGLSCTVLGAGQTVVVPDIASVWFITQTQLTTYSYQTNTYVTGAGQCGTTFPGGANSTQIAFVRTFNFPVQALTYSVNEIGYNDNSGADGNGNVRGRVVIPTTDTITPAQYYVVQILVTSTLSPNVPTAVLNVGTGIDIAGTVMYNNWDCEAVNTNGLYASYQAAYGNSDVMDESTPPRAGFYTVGAVSPNAHISQADVSTLNANWATGLGSAYTNVGLPVGVAQSTITITCPGLYGNTMYAIFIDSLVGSTQGYNRAMAPIFLLSFTTPYVCPNGTFVGNIVWQRQYTRTLINP
jgi:hypothetical protein